MDTSTKRSLAWTGIAVVALLIGGCAAEIPLESPELTTEQVQAKAHTIVPQSSSRSDVRAALGKPWLASDQFGFELYRDTDTQHQVLLVFAPYPVPVPMPGNDFEAYTLVTYGPDGRVTGVDAALGEDRFSEALRSSVQIRADGIEFSRSWKTQLSMPLERFLTQRPAAGAQMCLVLIGCRPDGVCWTRVEVDGKGRRELPVVQLMMPFMQPQDEATPQAAAAQAETPETCAARQAVLVNGSCVAIASVSRRQLVPLELEPGHHRLTFTGRGTTGEVRAELQCTAGEIVYATLGGKLLKTYTLAQQLQHGLKMFESEGTVVFSSTALGGPSADTVVVYYEGDWLVSH